MEYSTQPDIWFKSLTNGKFKKGHTPANKGKKRELWMSDEGDKRVRAAAAVSMLGKKNPNAGRKGKPIFATDKDGKRTRYQSIVLCAESLGVDRRDIVNCLKGRQKTSHGFSFRLTSSERQCHARPNPAMAEG